jgi:hypothetical protein
MAWESRNGKGRYYTRSRKVDGRITREYVGAGLAGELAAQHDHLSRAQRQAETAAWKTERARIEATDQDLDDLDALYTAAVRSILEAAGFHQHDRGEWRKRREKR